MRELPKGLDNVRAHILSKIWDADIESEQIATQAVKRILNSFSDKPDGRDLADGLTHVVDYFSSLSYRRGYRDAIHDYEETLKHSKTPHDRKETEEVVSMILREDPKASVVKICKALDKRGLSGWFGEEKYFGPRGGAEGKTKRGEKWIDGSSEQAVVQWIYRIRARINNELRANGWLKRFSEASLKPSAKQLRARAAVAAQSKKLNSPRAGDV